ncbi:hypothetical protein D3C73_539940 [compost metagenome]
MPSLPKICAILVGSILIAIGIDFFLKPHHVLDGGLVGIGLIIHYLFDMKVGLVMILCSIPIFTISWLYDRQSITNSVHGLWISSLFIDLLEPHSYMLLYYKDYTPAMSSIIGGVIIGTGIGIMLKYETSTGGTDLLAHMLVKRVFKKINVGVLIFIVDGLIIAIGGMLFSKETFFLSLLTITAGGIATSLCTLK